MKENKKKIVLTVIITLLPVLFGLILWDRLPEQIATHFNTKGVADGWSSKPVAVFGLPVFLTVMHLFMVFVTLNDPKRRNIGKGMLNILIWTMPVVSIIMNTATYVMAIGVNLNINNIVNVMVAILFIAMGNYMSKNHLNYSVGIRLPWTLSSEENWTKTHRLASKLWVLGGIILLLNIFINYEYLVFIVLIMITAVPAVYSFVLYKKEESASEKKRCQ